MNRTSGLLAVVVALGAGCGPAGDDAGSAAEAVVVCARGPTVEGVDVSEYQGTRIDWGAVHASGREFAIARIGDGTYRDPTFASNWAGIRAAGMIRGAYQFFRANRDAGAQAGIVCDAVGMLGPGDLPAMLDLEADNGVSPAGIRAAIDVWLQRVRACTGKTPLIYTAGWFWNPHVASSDYASYPLVVAAYGPRCPDLPQGWGDWAMFQYSDGEERYTPGVGAVPGIGQSVDRDRFNGTLDDLRRFVDSNRAPVGSLDRAGCDALAGWSMDPDASGTAIDVHLYVGGPAGSGAPGFPVRAGVHRDDLCAAIGSCDHGFSLPTPLAFLDGADHAVFAYGIDATGGANPLLGTLTLRCAPPTPTVPPARGVRRHVPNPEVLAAWRWTYDDVARLDDATVNAYADGPDVVGAPSLVRGDGEDGVYLVENRTLRHVPSPDVMGAWRFPWDTVQVTAPAAVHANLPGADVTPRPFLAMGSGPAVYLIDEPPPLWAQIERVDAPASIVAGAAATLTVTLRNRGSATWAPSDVWLAPVQPRDHDSALCDAASWRSCRQAVTVGAPVAPGATTTLAVTLRAPSGVATARECFALRAGAFYFSDPGQMGFADDALCRTFAIASAPSTPDAGPAADASADASADAALASDAGDDAALADDATPEATDAETDAAGDDGAPRDALTGSCGCRVPGPSAPSRAPLALVMVALLSGRSWRPRRRG